MTMRIVHFADRRGPLPRALEMTIIAQDPSVLDKRARDPERQILRACVKVPASRLQPGPRGPRFHVVDYDSTTGDFRRPDDYLPGDIIATPSGERDPYAEMRDRDLVADPSFRAQNVYAIAARTLAAFEFALGRPIPWAFGSHHLYLVPAAFAEENAYYSDSDQALLFGYFPGPDGENGYACLSHDIVAHETTHAILDGLRRRFDMPGLPDQPAFHEGFADVAALLSVFSVPEVVQALIGDPTKRMLSRSEVSEPRLKRSALLTLAEQLGDAIHVTRGEGLRRSVLLKPTTAWKDPRNAEWQEPHRRGEILVAAVTQALVLMWRKRLEALVDAGSVDRERAAEEGSRAAKHLLEMMIRAIDYCPPIDFEFEDFLEAVLVSDAEVAPDDDHNYRGALREAFDRFGIEPPESESVILAEREDRPVSRDFNYQALRSDREEVFRFIWENAAFLGLDLGYYLHVEDVSPSTRIGPNGYVVSETVVNYVQELEATKAGLQQHAGSALRIPDVIPDETRLKIWGGGTLILDQFGGVKYHHAKPISDWDRQSRRLDYLLRQGLWDTKGRLGFSYGSPLGQRFAQFHQPDRNSSEEW